LTGIALTPDQMLVVFPKDLPLQPAADYVSVEYTDSMGRRWHVDTDRNVQHIL